MTETPQAQETVLVAEDDVLVRMPISQYLRDCGHKVVEAANADEAMTALLQRQLSLRSSFRNRAKIFGLLG
jgi:CheY-like chemotaxis protein